MNTLKFKSNINCNVCLKRVTPALNEKEGVQKWEVDLEHTDRILTVETDNLTAADIKNTIAKIGFQIESI